jgi:hypothetical protein
MSSCGLGVEFDMSISYEPSSLGYGSFKTSNILEEIHLRSNSFYKLDWHDIGTLNQFGYDYGV